VIKFGEEYFVFEFFKVVNFDHFKKQAGLPNSLCIFKVILFDLDNLYIFANSCYICEKT